MYGHGCVPIAFYLWMLKFEFHIIFTSQNFFRFFQKSFLAHSRMKTGAAWLDLAVICRFLISMKSWVMVCSQIPSLEPNSTLSPYTPELPGTWARLTAPP